MPGPRLAIKDLIGREFVLNTNLFFLAISVMFFFASGDKSTKFFTTKKDYFRLNDKQKEICDYIEINLEIENRDKLENLITNAL